MVAAFDRRDSIYQVRELPLESLIESATNPRKRFDIDTEFVSTIKAHGVIEPILVRPRDHDKPEGCEYEVVFGARRFRGSMVAGRKTIPAMVRELSDAEAYELQVIENGKRQDLDALEEAESYQVLHERFGHDIETIAAKVGKSRASVYQRITLNKLHPDAKKLYLAGKLTASTALVVARVPVSLQVEAAKEICEGRGEPMSAREAADFAQRKYMLKLVEAPFSRTDASLVPKAGACNACPKRTGSQNELFDSTTPKDMCTDPPCYQSKVDAQWEAHATKAKLDGTVRVLSKTENKAVFPSEWSAGQPREGYKRLDAPVYDDSKQRTYKELLKGSDVVVTLGRVNNQIIEMVKETDAKAAFKKLGHSFARKMSADAGSGEKNPDYKPPPKKEKDEEELERRTRALLTKAVVAFAVKERPTADFWRAAIEELKIGDVSLEKALVARKLVPEGTVSTYDRKNPRVTKALAEMSDGELRGLVVEMLCGPPEYSGAALGAFVELYGVDAKATLRRAKEEIQAEQDAKEAAEVEERKAKSAAAKAAAGPVTKTSSKDIKAKKAARKAASK